MWIGRRFDSRLGAQREQKSYAQGEDRYMRETRLVLTVAKEKRQPQNDGYIAIISLGSPQLGSSEVTILDVSVVKNMKEAKAWFRKAKAEQPWATRQ
jgi:hypothetical protein